MPTRHGITVSVIDAKNEAEFYEFGCQDPHKKLKIQRTVSTFIEAKSDVRFFVQVKVDKDFTFQEEYDPLAFVNLAPLKERSHDYATRQKKSETKDHFDQSKPVEELEKDGSLDEKNLRASDIGAQNIIPKGRRRSNISNKLSPAPDHKRVTEVPFDLMVSVFIDGREKPECRQMIYLDENNVRCNKTCTLKGRWVESHEASNSKFGRAGLLNWVFTDRGIEHLLAQTTFMDADTTKQGDLEDVTAQLGEEGLDQSKEVRAGKIDVLIRRVVAIESVDVDQKFKAYHYAGYNEDPLNIADDCTHTTSFAPSKGADGKQAMETFSLRQVGWNHFKKGEDFWAKFTFNYTSRARLVKRGICYPNGTAAFEGLLSVTTRKTPKSGKKRPSDLYNPDDQTEEGAEQRNGKPDSTPPGKPMADQSGNVSDGESEEGCEKLDTFRHRPGFGARPNELRRNPGRQVKVQRIS